MLAIAKQTASGVDARVHPTLVNRHHLLASVNGVFNAIYLEGDYSDRQIFQGKGAGEGPTASAIVADLIEAGKGILTGNLDGPGTLLIDDDLKMASMGEVECQHYIRIPAADRPGVLAQIANILASFNISIASVIQSGRRKRGIVPVILMTHLAKENALEKAVARITRLPMVKSRPLRLRVEG